MKLVFMMPALVTAVETVSASALQLQRTPKSASRLRPVFSGELLISAQYSVTTTILAMSVTGTMSLVAVISQPAG